jgi:pimeloyl-ACP methyl ester carboxylesterase
MENQIEMLPVPGARLHLETRGSGPLLVCIVGGNGDAESFGALADALVGRFTVVSYDRRGFVRSPVDDPVDDAARIAQDADDAVRVIEHCAMGPAHVLGSSSGAIVALELLGRAPSRVRTLVAHEPPAMTLLPDGAHWLAMLDGVYATYIASGVPAAMEKFCAAVGLPTLRPPPPSVQLPPSIADMLARMPVNAAFWLEHEIRTYPRYAPDLAALRISADRLVLGCGRDSRGTVLERPARALAEVIPARLVEFAGGHVGYRTDGAAFAAQLAEVVTRSATQ